MRFLLALLFTAAALAQAPLRVRLVTGGHNHDPSLYAMFDRQEGFVTDVEPHPKGYNGDLRKRVDVLVLYDMMTDIPEAQKKNLMLYLESGKGLVVLHHALCSHQDWPEWFKGVVGGRYVMKAEAGLPASTYKHGEKMQVTVAMKHPVTEGIPATFDIVDETYKDMWLSPDSKPLLKSNHPLSSPVVGWIGPYTKSRVVAIQLGHDHEAHENAVYRRLVRNAILWAGAPQNRD